MPNRRLDENYRPDYRLPAYDNTPTKERNPMFNSKTKTPAAPAAPVSNADRARNHADTAERLILNASATNPGVKRGGSVNAQHALDMSKATVHATLSLYYQREAQA